MKIEVTEEKKPLYFQLEDMLRLDTLIRYLTPNERIVVNQFRNNFTDKLPKKAIALNNYILNNNVKIDMEYKYNELMQLEYRDSEMTSYRLVNGHELYSATVVENSGMVVDLIVNKNKNE